MSLSIGIVGLPNVGKSTLFNALTKNSVPAENYPFCTIDPSVGIVAVPDERLYALSKLSNTKKIVPAIVEFVDIAGLVKGAADGEGLGNKFLSHIRETDAIAEVVRIFEDDKVMHVAGGVDPLFDIEIINNELILADIETCKKRKDTIQKDVKKGDKNALFLESAIVKLLDTLTSHKLANSCDLTDDERVQSRDLHLITMKKFLYVLNKKTGAKNLDETNDPRYVKLLEFFKENNFQYCVVDAKIEDELKDFEGDEKDMMRGEMGAHDDGIKTLITAGYKLLGLEVYFTTGEAETRAWTIKKGSTAPVAGQAIHTDFKEKFIRAEVVHCDDLLREGGFSECKAKGLMRTEGRDYIVKDGDVMEFKV